MTVRATMLGGKSGGGGGGACCRVRLDLAKTRALTQNAATALVAVAFIWAAVAKAIEPESLVSVLETAGRLSRVTAERLALAVVLFEFCLSGWILSGVARRAASLTATGFLLGASSFMVFLMYSESRSGCGCGLPTFGLSPKTGQLLGIVRNAFLIAMSLYGGRSDVWAAIGSGKPERNWQNETVESVL
ncbi:MAG: hypothetical protein J0L78_07665 [Planctomycetes bacterium]|nr:hypothetical protein [Planctomycetota bacterium]